MAVRKSTKDGLLMQYFRSFFYRLVNLISNENLPRGFGSFSVIDKKIIDELKKIDDYKPYARGLIATVGFKQKKVFYKRRARPKGKGSSKTSLSYLIDFAINGFISYSIFPIRLMTYTGLSLSFLSVFGAIVYLLLKIFYWKVTIPGITGVIFLILFFSGVQLFFLGIIGEYVGAIHSQVRKKPFVVIKEKINFKK
jgi:dolichol-phosphate mannosyltransferase